jgi:hypothetical protein
MDLFTRLRERSREVHFALTVPWLLLSRISRPPVSLEQRLPRLNWFVAFSMCVQFFAGIFIYSFPAKSEQDAVLYGFLGLSTTALLVTSIVGNLILRHRLWVFRLVESQKDSPMRERILRISKGHSGVDSRLGHGDQSTMIH